MPKKEKKTSTRRSAPMIKCKNCDMPVQGDLEKCPYCEAPLKRTLPKKGLLIGGIVGGTVVIVSLIAIASFAKKHDSIDPALLGSKDRLTLFDDGSEFESETSESEASSAIQIANPFVVHVQEQEQVETSCEADPQNEISNSKTITVDGNQYQIVDEQAYLVHWGSTNENVARIPAAINGYPVVSILANAFSDCPDINYISIGDNVTTIEQYSFYKCTKLREVYFPETVSSIKTYAFSSLKRCVTSKDSYAWKYMSLFADEVIEGDCLTIDNTETTTKETLPAATTSSATKETTTKETESEEKTAPDASEESKRPLPSQSRPSGNSPAGSSAKTTEGSDGKDDDSSTAAPIRTTAYVPPTTGYVPITRPNISPTYAPAPTGSYMPTTAYVPPTTAATTAPTTAPTTAATTEATTEETTETTEATTETTEATTETTEATTETTEATTETTEATTEETSPDDSTVNSTEETASSSESTSESLEPSSEIPEPDSSDSNESTTESSAEDTQPTAVPDPTDDTSASTDPVEPTSPQDPSTGESTTESSAEDTQPTAVPDPTDDTSASTNPVEPTSPTNDTSPVEPTEPDFVRDLDHIWPIIAQYAQKDPSSISAGSVCIDSASRREDFVGMSSNEDGSKTLWYVGADNIPVAVATLPGTATLPTEYFWYGETLTLISKTYDDAGNINGTYLFAYQNGTLSNILALPGDLTDNGDGTFWLCFNGQKTAHLFIQNGSFTELGYTQLSRNQAICYTGADEAIAYTQNATGTSPSYWLCADGTFAASTSSQTYRFNAAGGSYAPSAGAQVEILNVACQPSYSGLETVYPTVVDDYSSIGIQQLYDIPSGSTVIYNLDDVGMPETLQASGGALYINGSVAKSFDGASAYYCKAFRMIDSDPRIYLLSVASYPDGTTMLVIDWFDGSSLITATSSLNVLGSELTNVKITNAPFAILEAGKISITMDTPIVLPLFGNYTINALFTFSDGCLIPDDALSSPLVSNNVYTTARDITVYSDTNGGNPTTLPAGTQITGIRLLRGNSTVFLETGDHQFIDLMPLDADALFEFATE